MQIIQHCHCHVIAVSNNKSISLFLFGNTVTAEINIKGNQFTVLRANTCATGCYNIILQDQHISMCSTSATDRHISAASSRLICLPLVSAAREYGFIHSALTWKLSSEPMPLETNCTLLFISKTAPVSMVRHWFLSIPRMLRFQIKKNK
jgi:hypothetical protein